MTIPCGVYRHLPDVLFSTILFVDDADAVGQQQSILLERGTARRENGLVVMRQLDAYPEVDEHVLASLDIIGIGGAEIKPLSNMGLLNRLGVLRVVFYDNLHLSSFNSKSSRTGVWSEPKCQSWSISMSFMSTLVGSATKWSSRIPLCTLRESYIFEKKVKSLSSA